MRVAGVLLAAGASARLGQPKQLLELDGVPLVRRLTDELLAAGCADVAVVMGAHADLIRPALAHVRATLVDNWAWEEGVASSVRIAADFAVAHLSDGVLIAVCDQPALDRAHLGALIAAFTDPGAAGPDGPSAVASAYGGTVGVPAILPRRAYPALLALTGDQGARRVLRDDPATRSLPWPDGDVDLDTPEAVTAWRAALSSSRRTPRP
jgi:molybdenum cofactor cytidylyltransferase